APAAGRGELGDARAALGALGPVLYYLVMGRTPYDAPNDMEVLARLLSGAKREPLPESVPRAVREVVEGALARVPDKRFASAEAMGEALDAAQHEVGEATSSDVAAYVAARAAEALATRRALVPPVPTSPALPPPRVREAPRRARGRWLALGAIVLGVGAAIAMIVFRETAEERSARAAAAAPSTATLSAPAPSAPIATV